MKTNKEIKLTDLWFLDRECNPPVKVSGFKHFVKGVKWYDSGDGFLYIDPIDGAFVTCNTDETIFENYEAAMSVYENNKSNRINFVVGKIDIYKKELERLA